MSERPQLEPWAVRGKSGRRQVGSTHAFESKILLANCLPGTLHHFDLELSETLERSCGVKCESLPTVSIEQLSGAGKLWAAGRHFIRSAQQAFRLSGTTIIVEWPALGLWEFFVLAPLAVRNHVLVMIHDPRPLRKQFGMGRTAALFARLLLRSLPRMHAVSLTKLAQDTLASAVGVESIMVHHPIRNVTLPRPGPSGPVRVLGQYKPVRNLQALEVISRGSPEFELEIHGRGWPQVSGWTVADSFIPESEMDELIGRSSCVVIPYREFFQSGIAVRCLELATPVVGPSHEHLRTLFGIDWPGLVESDESWREAVENVIAAEREVELRTDHYRRLVDVSWAALIDRLATT